MAINSSCSDPSPHDHKPHHHHHHHHHHKPSKLLGSAGNSIFIDDDESEVNKHPRKLNDKRKIAAVDLTEDRDLEEEEAKKTRKKTKAKADLGRMGESKKAKKEKEQGEKRLRQFRKQAPVSYKEILERATSQRMFIIERTKTGTAEEPQETIELAGSTGNLYTVVIGKLPSCTCPHARKGNQCKHIVYVLNRTLRAPQQLQYQLAFITSELQEIFTRAPPLASEKAEDNSGMRKPVNDECPICCVDFNVDADAIVWCKAACGNNLHKACFEQWAAQKKVAGGGVTCPFCRSQWEGDADIVNRINRLIAKTVDGYTNVADQLGLSGVRDYSTYNPFWVMKQQRAGLMPSGDYDGYEYYDD